MKMNLNLNDFVKKFVIKREESLLNKDLLDTKNKLSAVDKIFRHKDDPRPDEGSYQRKKAHIKEE